MSEKDEEKKKKKDISVDLSIINRDLSEAIRIQTQMLTSPTVLEALKTTRIFDSFSHISESLRYMVSVNKMIENNKIVFTAFQHSLEGLKTMFQYGAETRKLFEQYSRINKMVESIKIPEISIPKLGSELAAIPPQNDILVRSLLREIDLLEKELAKEKNKNKHLIALLDEKRKDLKKQYVT